MSEPIPSELLLDCIRKSNELIYLRLNQEGLILDANPHARDLFGPEEHCRDLRGIVGRNDLEECIGHIEPGCSQTLRESLRLITP